MSSPAVDNRSLISFWVKVPEPVEGPTLFRISSIDINLKFAAKLGNSKKCLYLQVEKEGKMSTRQLEIEGMIKRLGMEILPKNARLVLFGSQARDEATSDSDWDLLILIEGEKVSNDDFDKWVFPFISLGWSLGVDINPVVYTYGEWLQRQITPFYKNVMREGIELC